MAKLIEAIEFHMRAEGIFKQFVNCILNIFFLQIHIHRLIQAKKILQKSFEGFGNKRFNKIIPLSLAETKKIFS